MFSVFYPFCYLLSSLSLLFYLDFDFEVKRLVLSIPSPNINFDLNILELLVIPFSSPSIGFINSELRKLLTLLFSNCYKKSDEDGQSRPRSRIP